MMEAPKVMEARKAMEGPKAMEAPKAMEGPKAAEDPKTAGAHKAAEVPKAAEAGKREYGESLRSHSDLHYVGSTYEFTEDPCVLTLLLARTIRPLPRLLRR